MALKDWTTTVSKTYHGVEWPMHAGEKKVHKFLRKHFGDNDIFQAYHERRWIIIRNTHASLDMIYFRDEVDSLMFLLRWE